MIRLYLNSSLLLLFVVVIMWKPDLHTYLPDSGDESASMVYVACIICARFSGLCSAHTFIQSTFITETVPSIVVSCMAKDFPG